MVVKTTYRRRYVRAYYQMRTGFLRSTVYCTGDKVGVPHALKANRRMNNNISKVVVFWWGYFDFGVPKGGVSRRVVAPGNCLQIRELQV